MRHSAIGLAHLGLRACTAGAPAPCPQMETRSCVARGERQTWIADWIPECRHAPAAHPSVKLVTCARRTTVRRPARPARFWVSATCYRVSSTCSSACTFAAAKRSPRLWSRRNGTPPPHRAEPVRARIGAMGPTHFRKTQWR